MRNWGILLLSVFGTAVFAADPNCPAYPGSDRDTFRLTSERDTAYQAFSQQAAAKRKASGVTQAARTGSAIERKNLIDDYILGRMDADGVTPAPLSEDSDFVRRVYLDLTGRIPTIDQAERFLGSSDANKRALLIDELLNSPAYVDRWTLFYGNLFEITSRYYNYISVQGRNRFVEYIRDFLRNDRSYADVAREIISSSGDAHTAGPPNFIVRGFQQGDPIQDTWDTLTDRTTVRFLGMKSECVSCHDGRRHLEEINLYLAGRKRTEFWGMSAFFSRTDIQQVTIDAFSRQMRNLITNRSNGAYYSVVSSGNPGPRPLRYGGPYEPKFFLTGEAPKSGEWRAELGRMVTADRQFARAAANYLWAAMFVQGIVDPPEAWDLARIDPKNPPKAPWAIQPSNPELIEALADEFQRTNYSVKSMIRLLANSSAYQLSSKYEGQGQWRPEYERYFAKHSTRRMSAEEVYDAMSIATMTETPMVVEGYDKPVMYANQLPDVTEPRYDGNVRNILTQFGRGDWWQTPRSSKSTILQVLFVMNDASVNYRTFATRDGGRTTRVAEILQSNLNDEDAMRRLYMAALSRWPTDDEVAAIKRAKTGPREQWLSDVEWALLNKLDFLFNH